MTGIERLESITDAESAENIREITNCFISQVNPLKVFLFGSFADGTYNDESDYDFYLVIEDGGNVSDTMDKAYDAVMYVKKRPVDIVVGTNSRFERKGKSKHSLMGRAKFKETGFYSMIK